MRQARRYVLTPAAEVDLSEIVDFIRRDSPGAARRILGELRAAMQRLAAMPQMGHVREDLVEEPVRFWPVRSYLIIYRPEAEPLEIVRILHGARDVRSILGEDE